MTPSQGRSKTETSGGTMKRRDFLMWSAAAAGTLALRRRLATAEAHRRAAVVIGVDKAGHLPVLQGAASGAKTFGDWLRGEGFEVLSFLDDIQPVKVGDVFNAVNDLVRRGTLDQLVVYFSGHGFVSQYAEYWVLSGAPENPNEAVSLVESVILARDSAIANVVFISDACRSTS